MALLLILLDFSSFLNKLWALWKQATLSYLYECACNITDTQNVFVEQITPEWNFNCQSFKESYCSIWYFIYLIELCCALETIETAFLRSSKWSTFYKLRIVMGNIKRQRMSILFLIYFGLIVFYYFSMAAWQIIPRHSSLKQQTLMLLKFQ